MKSDIQKLINENWEKSKFISLSLDRGKVKILTDATSFLDEIYQKVPLRTRAYVIKNDITESTIPKCICGKVVNINQTNPELGFRKYCGPQCSRSDKTINKELIEKLDNYEFLYQEKIIQQKSIEQIASEEIIQSNRLVLNGKELDIYIPEKNLAIEYNGLYSHCYRPWEEKECLIKNSQYHLHKTIECEKQSIQLLQFYSDEWNFKSNIVKNIIQSKLELNQKIYARKCEIVEVDIQTKNEFLNQYHMQGEDKSSIKLGLEYNNELVCIMTFAKSRFNQSYDWELTRFCVKGGISVIGGFSKLLKSFCNTYGYSLVSYADRRYSNGNVYKTNGFNLIGINKPSYYYVDKNFLRRFNRMRFQKKYIGAYDCTEYEKAREMGYEKIWDCGTLAFGLK